MSNDKLRTSTKLLYGLGDVGNAIVNSAVQFYLLIFYTDSALVGPALAANALLLGKAWDAVNDPLFGWVSDRTRSRFGKRRVYMLFGALPLAVAIALLWRVPQALMLFRDGKTTEVPVERVEWHDSFIDCTRHLIDALRTGTPPVLDGPTGRAVLAFSLAAQRSAAEGREVRVAEMG